MSATEPVAGREGDGSVSVQPGPDSSASAFRRASEEGRGALVGYLPVGYPSVPGSLTALKALCGEGGDGPGVDLVEVGLP